MAGLEKRSELERDTGQTHLIEQAGGEVFVDGQLPRLLLRCTLHCHLYIADNGILRGQRLHPAAEQQ